METLKRIGSTGRFVGPIKVRRQLPINLPVEKNTFKSSPKELQSSKTLEWLEANFTRCPGVCLPRCIMYAHYLNFCQENNFPPSCAATFGKIMRQKFPELTTRRLGTRGNSKYHYYGVAIKETSAYYQTVYAGVGLTRFSDSKLGNNDSASQKILNAAKSGSLLPDFPSPYNLNLPAHVEKCKLDTFMIMYRTHCQCILDTATAKNYDAIGQYIIHFWKGIPSHLKSLFEVTEIVSLVCVCDSITFMVLNDSLVPSSLQDITDSTLSDIRNFVSTFEGSVEEGLKDSNKNLLQRKMQVVRRFVQAVQRQISFLHLAQSFKEVFSDRVIAQKLLDELDSVDVSSVGVQAMYTAIDCARDNTELHQEYLGELKELLRMEACVEKYIEWLEKIIQTQVLQHSDAEDIVSFKMQAQQFLLAWSFFGTRVMHMLTLNNSRTYGPFHLLRMMLDEYLLLIIETRLCKLDQQSLQRESEKIIKTSDKQNEELLRVSKFVTKSRFGPPRSPILELPKKVSRKVSKTRKHQKLPAIATLKTTTKRAQIDSCNSPNNALNVGNLPNDPFVMQYGEGASFSSLLTLTPPSSPVPGEEQQDIATTKTINRPSANVSKKVEASNLVDEHFRNCGIAQVQENRPDNSGFSRFLQAQNQTITPYEVRTQADALQCSFSQILNSDVLMGGEYSAEQNDHVRGYSTEQNRSDVIKSDVRLAFTDQETGREIEEGFLGRNTDEDEDFSAFNASILDMSF